MSDLTALLDRLEGLHQKATPMPWEPNLECVFGPDGDSVCDCHGNVGAWPEPIMQEDNAHLIAESRNALPELIAIARAAELLRDDYHQTTDAPRDGRYFSTPMGDLFNALESAGRGEVEGC